MQSSRLLLEAARGEREPFDHAIIADTQDEPQAVYDWLEWLKEEVARSRVPIPIHVVTAGRLSDEALRLRVSKKTGNVYLRSLIPAYVRKNTIKMVGRDLDDPSIEAVPVEVGERSLMGRRCTTDYKIRVLTKTQRKLARIPRGCKQVRAIVTIGISIDEWQRVKTNAEPWAINKHPLVDERISRRDCEDWLWAKYRKIAPKSACRQCPFHGDDYWLHMKKFEPEEFEKAVKFDHDLRTAARKQTGTAALRGDVYLHSSCIPLDRVQFGAVPDHLQIEMFGNECEGMCGV